MAGSSGNDTSGPKREPLTIDLAPDPAPTMPEAPKKEGTAGDYGLAAASAGVGGVLGLALAVTLAGLGAWPGSGGVKTDPEADKTRAALSQRVDDLAKRLDSVKTEAAKLVTVIEPRLTQAEARLQKLEPVAETVAQTRKTLTEQAARLEALAKTGVEPAAAAANVADDLVKRLADLEARLAATPVAAAAVPVEGAGDADKRLAEIEARMASLAAGMKGLEAVTVDLPGLKAAASDARVLVAKQVGRVDDLNDRLVQVAGRLANSSAARNDAVLALALGDLRAAVDAGRPYGYELDVAAKMLPLTNFAALKASADTGAATVQALRERFPALARRMLEVDRKTATGGVVSQLLASARQSVSVRSLDDSAVETLEGRLARIERLLATGDAVAASQNFGQLPETLRALDPGFATALAARAEADDLLKTATRNAMNKLAGHAE